MRVRDLSWTLALCTSLTAHAAFIDWRAYRYIDDHRIIRLAGWGKLTMIRLEDPDSPPLDEVGQLGEAKGTGYATDNSPGDVELLARKGDQDQSFLSRDPD